MPIYEYRCPNGHVFELFKKMDEPAPEACEVCGASPVELVLYPVAIHYKGSGFYATDYGKGTKRKAGGESSSSDGGTSGGDGAASASAGAGKSKSDGSASSSGESSTSASKAS